MAFAYYVRADRVMRVVDAIVLDTVRAADDCRSDPPCS